MYSIVDHDGDSQRLPEDGFRVTRYDGLASVTLAVDTQLPVNVVEAQVYLIYEGRTFSVVASSTAPGLE